MSKEDETVGGYVIDAVSKPVCRRFPLGIESKNAAGEKAGVDEKAECIEYQAGDGGQEWVYVHGRDYSNVTVAAGKAYIRQVFILRRGRFEVRWL